MLKKRIDIHTSAPNNGLLEFQSAVQDGYVIDITNRGGVARRGLHIFLELIKATPVESTPVETQEVIDTPKEVDVPTTPKRTVAKKTTTEDVK